MLYNTLAKCTFEKGELSSGNVSLSVCPHIPLFVCFPLTQSIVQLIPLSLALPS